MPFSAIDQSRFERLVAMTRERAIAWNMPLACREWLDEPGRLPRDGIEHDERLRAARAAVGSVMRSRGYLSRPVAARYAVSLFEHTMFFWANESSMSRTRYYNAAENAYASSGPVGETCTNCDADLAYCSCRECANCDRRFTPASIDAETGACLACRDELYVHDDLEGGDILRSEAAFNVDTEQYTSRERANSVWRYVHNTRTWHTRPAATDNLLSYSANPFHYHAWDKRNKPDALVFGVELEMEATERVYDSLDDEDGERGASQEVIVEALAEVPNKFAIMKEDGSLDDGVELVTMPFTLEQHLNGTGPNWKGITEAVCGIAKSGKGTSHCGIHVHINRKALSALTIGKMLVFLNSESLAPLMTIIAQRPASSYCARSKKKVGDGKRSSESRYDMMNVGVRHPTCEIRMFRGNLKLERIYKNIEFCHAAVMYCREASVADLSNWASFSRWLLAHRGTYKHLVEFLIQKNTAGFMQMARKVPAKYARPELVDA